MSELRFEIWTMPVADLGLDNPFPFFTMPWSGPPVVEATNEVPAKIARQSQYGRPRAILPYTVQDGYDRERRPQDVQVAVLENERLRAVLLLQFGGRVWSLYDKEGGCELLATNRVLQPANLALRNAWFSGGIEWNVGTIGHSAFTMSPLFAARVETEEGMPLLRLYEWERLRQIPFQIDAFLPDDSPVLFVHIRLLNPHRDVVPMAWWSNAAVPETSGVRVIVPADAAFSFVGKGGKLAKIPTPTYRGLDYSYPLQLPHAGGFYFEIPDRRRRWITALDQNGYGLVQTSTERLRGRTLFGLGTQPGGNKWQEYLVPEGQIGGSNRYLEIESGLACSHLEHVPMPPQSEWSWLEAYGPLVADPARVHGSDWQGAQDAVEEALNALVPETMMEATALWSKAVADTPPAMSLQRGSGWGALARRERLARDEPALLTLGLSFDDDTLTPAQTPWLELLEQGSFPDCPPDQFPNNFVVGRHWRPRLEAAVAAGRADNWSGWYHLGIMRAHDGEVVSARTAWERSLTHVVTPWALRNLARLAAEKGEPDEAASRYHEALQLAPDLHPLVVETGRFFVESGRSTEWLALLPTLPLALRQTARLRLLQARALLDQGETDATARFFADAPILVDVREGELTLDDLWFEWQARKLAQEEDLTLETARYRARREHPVPPDLDFNMYGNSDKT